MKHTRCAMQVLWLLFIVLVVTVWTSNGEKSKNYAQEETSFALVVVGETGLEGVQVQVQTVIKHPVKRFDVFCLLEMTAMAMTMTMLIVDVN